jgi:hypothetical protein
VELSRGKRPQNRRHSRDGAASDTRMRRCITGSGSVSSPWLPRFVPGAGLGGLGERTGRRDNIVVSTRAGAGDEKSQRCGGAKRKTNDRCLFLPRGRSKMHLTNASVSKVCFGQGSPCGKTAVNEPCKVAMQMHLPRTEGPRTRGGKRRDERHRDEQRRDHDGIVSSTNQQSPLPAWGTR